MLLFPPASFVSAGRNALGTERGADSYGHVPPSIPVAVLLTSRPAPIYFKLPTRTEFWVPLTWLKLKSCVKVKTPSFSPIPSGIRKLLPWALTRHRLRLEGGPVPLGRCQSPPRSSATVLLGSAPSFSEIPTVAAVGCKGSSSGPQKLQLFDIVRRKAGGTEGLCMKGRAQRKPDPGMSARYSVGNRLS